MSEQQLKALQQLVDRRSAFYLLQYLLGSQQFMGLDFQVTPAVLIPRWDTECLVEEALRLLAAKQKPLVADVCCGSGAIGLSLAHYLPQAEVWLSDISQEALTVCCANAEHLALGERCRIVCGDLLQPLQAAGRRFDLVAANPPYIPEHELSELPPDVCREPRLALVGGADGLTFYRRLAVEALPFVKDGGWLLLEMASAQKEAVSELLAAAGWQVEQAICDLGGRHRALAARK